MRLRLMPFSNLTLRICPGCVKIAKTDMVNAINIIVIFENLFNHEFGFPIRINRLLRMIFRHWGLQGITIGGTGRGENEEFHTIFNHDVKKIYGIDHIVSIILRGVIDGLAYITECRIVHDSLNRICFETET